MDSENRTAVSTENNPDLLNVISSNLKQLLAQQKITQKELAEAMGIAPASVSDYCKGRRVPNAEFFVVLKNLYGISIDDFLTKTSHPSPAQPAGAAIDRATLATYRKYGGIYDAYYMDTSKYKGRDFLPADESLQHGLLCLYELPASLDTPNFGSAAVLGIGSQAEAIRIRKDMERLEKPELILDYIAGKHQNTAYYGSFELTQEHAFIEMNHEATDKTFMIFYRVNSNKDEFIGGMGTINSVSKGREHMPVVQFIGISKYPLNMSEEEIQHALLLNYPNFKAEDEAAEMLHVFENLFSVSRDDGHGFTTYQKTVMIRSTLERAIKKSLERNMFRYGKISERDDDEWYHLIKLSRPGLPEKGPDR